jgi:hypothetical protein
MVHITRLVAEVSPSNPKAMGTIPHQRSKRQWGPFLTKEEITCPEMAKMSHFTEVPKNGQNVSFYSPLAYARQMHEGQKEGFEA